jgi:alpha-L-fucosidase
VTQPSSPKKTGMGNPSGRSGRAISSTCNCNWRELLTRYGPVAIIWFDGLHNQRKYDGARVVEMIREYNPSTLVNDRIGVDADYETPEQFIPTAIPTKDVVLTGVDPKVSAKLKNTVPRPEDFRLWETCMTINNTWAYNKNDHDYKSEQTLIRGLVEVASRGGNFLLNVGPQPDGQIQPEFQQRLRAIGELAHAQRRLDLRNNLWTGAGGCRFADYGQGQVHLSAPIRLVSSNLRDCRHRGKSHVGSAAGEWKTLTYRQTEGKLQIDLPQEAPDANVSVIAVKTY